MYLPFSYGNRLWKLFTCVGKLKCFPILNPFSKLYFTFRVQLLQTETDISFRRSIINKAWMLVGGKKSLKVLENFPNLETRKESGVSCYVVTPAAWWSKGASAAKPHSALDGHDDVFPCFLSVYRSLFHFFRNCIRCSLKDSLGTWVDLNVHSRAMGPILQVGGQHNGEKHSDTCPSRTTSPE